MNGAGLLWREDALGEALAALATAAGLAPREETLTAPRAPADVVTGDAHARSAWIEAAAEALHVEAEPVELTPIQLETALATLGIALVRVPDGDAHGYLAVLATDARSARVLTPSGRRARVTLDAVRSALVGVDEGAATQVERWLAIARVPARRAKRARRELLDHALSTRRIDGLWLLRPRPGAGFFRQLHRSGATRRALVFAAATLTNVALGIVGWILVGRGALGGVVERGWLGAWVLVALTGILVQLVATSAAGRLAIDVAGALKQRLLCGALRLDPNDIRVRGSGQLLAIVSESEAIESAGLGGALGAVAGLVQLVSAAAVLVAGAGGWFHMALLLAWTAVVAWLAVRLGIRRAEWTDLRFGLASDFVQNVVGNRTRVAQQAPGDRHVREDALLERYEAASRAMDAAAQSFSAMPARGWLALGLVGLVPTMLAGRSDPLAIAVAIGGILQAQGAFGAMVTSVPGLLAAAIAWRSVGELYRAAGSRDAPGVPDAALDHGPSAAASAHAVLEVRGLSFRYREGGDPVVHGCDMALEQGDRVLLEGRSGGGKSTFAALLAGLHTPRAGLVLLRGLDRRTIGAAGWRRRVATAPQFHENHLVSATLAFNLLMGRQWPAPEEDRREAEAVCRRLGLGAMLDKMPSGLDQIVGETGWQLSHGERSRVFLARALLQRSDVVILDESFGALDPLTMKDCLGTVLERAPTLMVIAHP